MLPVRQVRTLCLPCQRKGEILKTPSPRVPLLRAVSRISSGVVGTSRNLSPIMHASSIKPISEKSNRLPLPAIIYLTLAVLLLAWSGFFTMDFLLSGVYTFPRTSRAITLTFAVIILSYEFIYKEHLTQYSSITGILPLKVVFYSCIIPYVIGSLVLLMLGNLN